VFCPRCGTANPDGTAFCSACGFQLAAGGSPISNPSFSLNAPTGERALLAAFLNLFFGIGYLYLGYRKVVGAPAIAFVLIALVIYIFLGVFSAGFGTVLLAVLFAIDGWQKGSGGKGFISAE